MACPVLQALMAMHHELLRGEYESAVQALNTRRVRTRVQLGHEQTLALAETLVVHLKGPVGVLELGGGGGGTRELLVGARW